jgi:hypothetical protein
MKRSQIISVYVISLCLSVILANHPCSADSIGFVNVTVKNGVGEVIPKIMTQLKNGDNKVAESDTDDTGQATYQGIQEGPYTILVNAYQSENCSTCGKYLNKSVDVTVSKAAGGYDNISDTLELGDITLSNASGYLTVTVLEGQTTSSGLLAAGDPVAGMKVQGWQDQSSVEAENPPAESQNGVCLTDNEGKCHITVKGPSNMAVGAAHPDGDYTKARKNKVSVSENKQAFTTLYVEPTNATINVNLKKSDGSSYTVEGGGQVGIHCSNLDKPSYIFTEIVSTGSSKGIPVIGGATYYCSAWADGYAVSPASTTVQANSTASVDVTLYQKNTTLTVQVKDPNGNLITDDLNLIANAFVTPGSNSTNLEDADEADFSAGTASISLPSGFTYDVSISFEDDDGDQNADSLLGGQVAANGSSYVTDLASQQVTLDGQNQTLTFTLYPATATLAVTLLKSDGSPAKGFVQAQAVVQDDDDKEFQIGTQTSDNGTVNLGVVGGVIYNVTASFDESGTQAASTDLPPARQQVAPQDGATLSLSMKGQSSDSTLDVALSLPTGEFPDSASCYAFDPDSGVQTLTDAITSGNAQLSLITGRTWRVGCLGYKGTSFYRSADLEYSPSGATGSLSVPLTAAGNYYESTTYIFSATATTTLTLPDGQSTLLVPASAIGNTGDVSVTVGTPLNYSVGEEGYPVLAFDFEAFDGNGSQVSEFNSNLVLTWYYDPNLLPEGMSEETLAGNAYDSATKSWGAPESTVIDTESDRLVISLSHFSPYGIVGPRGLGLPEAPSKPKVKKVKTKNVQKRKKILIKWKSSDKNNVYQLRLVKKGKKSKTKTYKTKKTKKTLKLKPGRYTASARGGDTVGESASDVIWGNWSTSKKFRVKK